MRSCRSPCRLGVAEAAHPDDRVVGRGVDVDVGREVEPERLQRLIDAKIAGLGDWRGAMLAKLRALIHAADPEGWKRPYAISMGQYGPTVGVPRILETYRRLGLRQTFFIPGWCVKTYPRAVEAILEGGHEIGCHGWIHENPAARSLAEQGEDLDRALEAMAAGATPAA